MSDIVIIDAVRTPVGRRNGALRETHPVRLGSYALCEVLARANVDPALVDHVIFGNVSQVSEQTFNIARNIVLDAELPIEVPGTTVDFQCGSSQQAIHLAAGMIKSGQAEIVVAGGVESMTRVPMGSSMAGGQPFTDTIMANHNMINQGKAADEIAAKWGISRDKVDQIGYESHMRAAKATEAGILQKEFLPIDGLDKEGNPITLTADEGIRPGTTVEKMGTLDVVFSENGVTTAGNSSQISDGAAAVLMMTAEKAEELGLKPRARIVDMVTVGSDPHLMLTGPTAATRKLLERTNMTMDDIDLFEVNEAFAAVVAMWEQDMDADMSKVNVHGGAIALGHPLGCSGARLMTTLLNALDTHGKTIGLQTMCCGGGMATGTIIERLS